MFLFKEISEKIGLETSREIWLLWMKCGFTMVKLSSCISFCISIAVLLWMWVCSLSVSNLMGHWAFLFISTKLALPKNKHTAWAVESDPLTNDSFEMVLLMNHSIRLTDWNHWISQRDSWINIRIIYRTVERLLNQRKCSTTAKNEKSLITCIGKKYYKTVIYLLMYYFIKYLICIFCNVHD